MNSELFANSCKLSKDIEMWSCEKDVINIYKSYRIQIVTKISVDGETILVAHFEPIQRFLYSVVCTHKWENLYKESPTVGSYKHLLWYPSGEWHCWLSFNKVTIHEIQELPWPPRLFFFVLQQQDWGKLARIHIWNIMHDELATIWNLQIYITHCA